VTDIERWEQARKNVARAEEERIEALVNIEFDRLQAVERFALVAAGVQEYSVSQRQQMELERH